MLVCNLYANARNGNVSDLLPIMKSELGNRIASIHHFVITEQDGFYEWYSNGAVDVNGEPLLVDGKYFENGKGEKWFLDQFATFTDSGIMKTEPIDFYVPAEYHQAKTSFVNNFNAKLDNLIAEGIESEQLIDSEALRPIEKALLKYNLAERQSPYGKPTAPGENDISYYKESSQANMKISMDQAWDLLPKTIFMSDQLKVWESILNGAPDRDLEIPGLENIEEGRLYTYEEYFLMQIEKFMEDQEFLEEISQRVKQGMLEKEINGKPNPEYIKIEEIKEIWKKMTQKIGSDHKIVRSHYGDLYMQISDNFALRMLDKQVEYNQKRELGYKQIDQDDIAKIDKYFKSVVDFSDKQLVMQRMAHNIQIATGKSEKESYDLKHQLNNLMNKVADDYSRFSGEKRYSLNIFKTMFHRVNAHNEPYEWMFEREITPDDPNDPLTTYTEGAFTGNMIQRFEMKDEEAYSIVYEKNLEGFYVKHTDWLIDLIKNSNDLRNRKFLTPNEYKRTMDIIKFFDRIYKDPTKALNEKDQNYKKRSEKYLRKAASRVMVIQNDSQTFFEMQKKAEKGHVREGNKINLYDFLLMKNKTLSEDNENGYTQPMDRAFMPQLSMNVYEAYHRSETLLPAWTRLIVNLDNTDLYEDYTVEHTINSNASTNGTTTTKTWKEWREYYSDPERTRFEKIKSPFILKSLYNQIQKKVSNGVEPDPTYRKQMAVSFSRSNTMPFRTIAKKQDFSVNAARIFMVHFDSLIFRKHHNPIVPSLQAAMNHYEGKSRTSGRDKDFENTRMFIQDFTDRYMFGYRKGEFNNTIFGNIVDQLITTTVLAFLAASPETSGMNLMVGLNESLKSKIAKDGFSDGTKNFGIGLKRMWEGGNIGNLSPKAKAFIEYFNIETFSNIDVENQQDYFFGAADHLMWMQKKGETIIRGVSIMGELSADQWASFEVNKDGKIEFLNTQNFPKIDQVKEWNYYVSSVQGNYTPEGRRNYHNFTMIKAAMLFKTWMVDYTQERFKPIWRDMYTKQREGYYTTAGKLLLGYLKVIDSYKVQPGGLKTYQKENLRKMAYDVMMYSLLAVLGAGLDDEEDKAMMWTKGLILKYQSQLFIQLYPKDIIGMASRPFPSMGILEGLTGAVLEFANLNFEKSGELAWGVVPGHRVVDFGLDMADIVD